MTKIIVFLLGMICLLTLKMKDVNCFSLYARKQASFLLTIFVALQYSSIIINGWRGDSDPSFYLLVTFPSLYYTMSFLFSLRELGKWYSNICNNLYCAMRCKWYSKVLLFNISYSNVSFKRFSSYRRLGLFNRSELRSYSTSSLSVVPVKRYSNADTDKPQILKENKGKSGVYLWRNLITGKTYVGSSVDLGNRLKQYFSYSHISSVKRKSKIYASLLTATPGGCGLGYYNFSFEILEFCDRDKAVSREQYYMDLLKPEYNILKTAGSLLGFKHLKSSKIWEHLKRINANPKFRAKLLDRLKRLHRDPEFRAKRLEALKRVNRDPKFRAKLSERLQRLHASPEFRAKHLERWKHLNGNPDFKAKRLEGLNRFHASPEFKAKHSEHLKVLNSSPEHKEHLKRLHLSLKGRARPEGAGSPSIPIEVLDTETNETTVYPSLSEAALAVGVSSSAINQAFKRKPGESSVFVKRKRYQVTKFST